MRSLWERFFYNEIRFMRFFLHIPKKSSKFAAANYGQLKIQDMEFKYAPMFQLGKDETEYYLLTKDFVSVSEFEGHEILKVAPEGLTLMAQQAFHDPGERQRGKLRLYAREKTYPPRPPKQPYARQDFRSYRTRLCQHVPEAKAYRQGALL